MRGYHHYNDRRLKLPVLMVMVALQTMLSVQRAESANVLLSGTLGEGSHFTALVPIGRSLVRQGHNVTFLISEEFAYRARDPEISDLFGFEMFSYLDPDYKAAEFFRRFAEIGFLGSNGLLQNFEALSSADGIFNSCDAVLSDEGLMRRLEGIDAIVTELPWPCGVLIKSYLTKRSGDNKTVRLILSSATAPMSPMFTVAGSPFNPSFQPASFTGYTHSMTFAQRTINTLYLLGMNVFADFFISRLYVVADKFDLDLFMRSRHTLHEGIDLFLTNTDFAVEFPFALTPNVIPVGGLTARPAKPLDQDLEDFVNGSGEHGVVVFAMGSYFANFTNARPDVLEILLEAFSRFPQRVVMQLKGSAAEHRLPANVKALPWIPQNDLLGHPQTRAFVSHAGNNGYLEALYHGVPMVVIPLFGDHFDVNVRVVSRGLGLSIDKESISVDEVHSKLHAVLNEPRYADTTRRLSAIFRDRPLAPADRAAFWINHVIKYGGEYMRSPVHDLSFVAYNLIDVVAFLVLISALILYAMFSFCKCCVSRCFQKTAILFKSKEE